MAKRLPKRTRWFGMWVKPTREGEYEGRERNTGLTIVVHWRKLDDAPKPGWYYWKGVLGPFNCWQAADIDMTAWRGLSAPAPKEPTNV